MGNVAEEAASMLGGRIAIVTGAGGGLGRSHALQLAKLGTKILVNDIGVALAKQVAREIELAGGEAIAFAASVRDEARIEDMVARAMDAGVVWLDCAGEVVPDYGFMPMERELAGGPGAELKAANS